MVNLATIQKPVAAELKDFEPFFRESFKSGIKLLELITNYIYRHKGKQMRPLLVFLSAKLIRSEIKQSTYVAASMIELLHTASLVHDDVVDDAYERRGFYSVFALWKSKISVLAGDFILSKGLLIAVQYKEYDILEIVSRAVKEMAEGELLQIEKARKLDITEEIYFEVIRKKTASLLAACSEAGAKSANANEKELEVMRKFGEYLGIAFQLKDDLFDYQKVNLTGKPSGNDIKEKKITLPLIYTLNKVSKKQAKKLFTTLKRNNKENKEIVEIIETVQLHGGLEYTEQQMNKYKQMSVECLNYFPDSATKTALIQLVSYVIERNN